MGELMVMRTIVTDVNVLMGWLVKGLIEVLMPK